MEPARCVLLIYWGRQGISGLTHDIWEAFSRRTDTTVFLSLSRYNISLDEFDTLGDALWVEDIFAERWGVLKLWRIAQLRRDLALRIRKHNITDVITLMPHVWSFGVSSAIRAAGARYHTIIHDAQRHPGDHKGYALPLILRDARQADTIITLSEAVSQQLTAKSFMKGRSVRTLFHPVTGVCPATPLTPPASGTGKAWRFLFLGRVLPYKGLPLLIKAMELLQHEGRPVELSVMGEGSLEGLEQRLTGIKASIVNRWLSEDEIVQALGSHHALILSHIEASQSGVAAAALGAGLPVVATPIGGLEEQIMPDETGVMASRVDAEALAAAMRRLMDEPGLYQQIAQASLQMRDRCSPDAFVAALLQVTARE